MNTIPSSSPAHASIQPSPAAASTKTGSQPQSLRKRLLTWTGVLAAVVLLNVLVGAIRDLRMFDVVFVPSVCLLAIVSITSGYLWGTALTLRRCRRVEPGNPRA